MGACYLITELVGECVVEMLALAVMRRRRKASIEDATTPVVAALHFLLPANGNGPPRYEIIAVQDVTVITEAKRRIGQELTLMFIV